MGKLILVTGGARSGKSTYAENKAKEFGTQVLYIATAKPIDEEMEMRIARHRAQRPAGWVTLEAYKELDLELESISKGKNVVMLDCITVMVSNLMLDESWEWDELSRERVEEIEQTIMHQIERLITFIKTQEIPFILVTNEVGLGVVPPSAMGRDFRDIGGRVNQLLARVSEEVYFCVSGIPVKIK